VLKDSFQQEDKETTQWKGMALIRAGQKNWGMTTRQHEWKTLMSINEPCLLGSALTTKKHNLRWDGNDNNSREITFW
jgi:hypothetical protein